MRLVGVELGGTKCVCICADGDGRILDEVRIPTTTAASTLAAIEAALDGWAPFDALGIGCFGPLQLDPAVADWGDLTSTPKPGWAGANVGARLRDRYGVPTGLETDVIAAAVGEARWGAAQGLSDIAYVTIGTGVGVGLLAGGRPLGGFGHGELGHLRLARAAGDGWPGSCPYHGDCVEGLVSGPAIAARIGRSAADLATDDPVWTGVAHTIGALLHAIVLTAAPRRIILGGGVMDQPQLLPMVRTALRVSLNGYVVHDLLGAGLVSYVLAPALGGRAGPLGAIAIADRVWRTDPRHAPGDAEPPARLTS
jgi:fructokinase